MRKVSTLARLHFHCRVIASLFQQVDVLFLVGHNNTLTELAEHLSGRDLGNIPTCGIVALEYSGEEGFTDQAGGGKLGFFWFPKDRGRHQVNDAVLLPGDGNFLYGSVRICPREQ